MSDDSIREYDAYIHYHEYDFKKQFPTVVVQVDGHSFGYRIEEGGLERVCICYARSEHECCCGGYEIHGRTV